MPFKYKNRFMDAVFGRWSVGTTLSAHTGTPFSVTNSGTFLSSSFGGVVLADVLHPNIQGVCGRSAINTPCFTVSQFAPAATQANFGNLPRNSFRGPWFLQYGFVTFQDDPNTDIARSGLGLITSTAINPSGPYGSYGGPSGRALAVTGKVAF